MTEKSPKQIVTTSFNYCLHVIPCCLKAYACIWIDWCFYKSSFLFLTNPFSSPYCEAATSHFPRVVASNGIRLLLIFIHIQCFFRFFSQNIVVVIRDLDQTATEFLSLQGLNRKQEKIEKRSGVFLTNFEVFGNVVKHCLSCLIYLLNRN